MILYFCFLAITLLTFRMVYFTGTTEVLYAVEMNLRKELTVDGGSIGKFPVSPSLMIVESGHDTSLTSERTGKREKREESVLASLLSGVLCWKIDMIY